ncbi:hypothetical protein A2U01_0109293, partial [Trifolium medium]|nr:hypothetical protein [Trifolium medium]
EVKISATTEEEEVVRRCDDVEKEGQTAKTSEEEGVRRCDDVGKEGQTVTASEEVWGGETRLSFK